MAEVIFESDGTLVVTFTACVWLAVVLLLSCGLSWTGGGSGSPVNKKKTHIKHTGVSYIHVHVYQHLVDIIIR